MIKIILAEDHLIVRNGIRYILEQENDLEVVGEAENGAQVMELLSSGTAADLVLTDVSMAEMDGLMLAEELSRTFPEIKVIVLSMMDNEKYIFEAFSKGIKGYLLKNVNTSEMVFSIRQVAAGSEVICNELGMKMLRKVQGATSFTVSSLEKLELTSREREILALIAEGYTNSEIADKTFTSRRTIEGHRQSLITKMGVKNTAQLITMACKNGII